MSEVEQGSTPERLVTPESIFPLDVDLLASRLDILRASSTEMLQMVTEARGRWGKASDIYHNFPVEDFEAWHENAEDFTENATLQYRAGLLYGMDLAQNARSQHYMTNELQADDPEAYTSALDHLRESYRGLDDLKVNWVRQKERELRHTGTDILTLANATLQDVIFKMLGRKIKTEQDFDEVSRDIAAVHVGLVDGAIFVNALHAYTQDTEPQVFAKPVKEYIPTPSPRFIGHNLGGEDDMDGLVARYQFEPGDLLGAVKFLDLMEQENNKDYSELSSIYGEVAYTRKRLVQTTPNDFVRAFEIKKIGYRWLSKQRMGAYAVLGAGVDVATSAMLDWRGGVVPVTTVTLAAVVALRNRGRKKYTETAARNLDVPFVGRVK